MPGVKGLPNQTRIDQIDLGLSEAIKLSKKAQIEEKKEGIQNSDASTSLENLESTFNTIKKILLKRYCSSQKQ